MVCCVTTHGLVCYIQSLVNCKITWDYKKIERWWMFKTSHRDGCFYKEHFDVNRIVRCSVESTSEALFVVIWPPNNEHGSCIILILQLLEYNHFTLFMPNSTIVQVLSTMGPWSSGKYKNATKITSVVTIMS